MSQPSMFCIVLLQNQKLMKIISTGQGQTPPFGAQWQWCCAMRPSAPAVAAQSWGRRRVSDGARGCLPAGSTHTCPRSSSCSVVTASLTKFLKCQCPGHWHTSMFTLWSSLWKFENNRGPRERAAKHQTHKGLSSSVGFTLARYVKDVWE